MPALAEAFDPNESPFAISADRYVDAGFSILPVMVRDKVPGEFRGSLQNGSWTPMVDWNSYAHSKPSEASVARWKTWPDANIGVVLGGDHAGYALVAVDIDTDDADEIELLQSSIPVSPMQKRGARGYTAFYRGSKSLKTKRYIVEAPLAGQPNRKRTLVELLTGNAPRQTVMPPSLHPHGMRYQWQTGDGIVPVSRLPVLTQDHLDTLEDNLGHLGWNGGIAERQPAEATDDAASDYFRDINSHALDYLDLWVGDLGLPKLKRHSNGRWEAVNTLRSSGSGRTTMERKANLSFHRKGVKDMGNDEKYTPLRIVSEVCGLTCSGAVDWLRERIGPTQQQVENAAFFAPLDEKLQQDRLKRETAKLAIPPHDPETGELLPPTPDNDNAPAPSRRVPASPALVWERHGEPSPFTEPFWIIKSLIPTEGNLLLAGVSTAGKTFCAVSMAVSFATGEPFLGLPIRQKGGSMIVVGEGRATIRKRIRAASQAIEEQNGVSLGKLPISYVEASLTKGALSSTLEALKAESARMEAEFGVKPRVLFIDTLAACFEFEDENSSAEATKAMNAIRDLGRELGCLTITTAHHGKAEGSGVRGSSAFTASADDILTVLIEKSDDGAVRQRQLRVTKTRDGEIGRSFGFDLVPITIGQDRDGDDIVSAFVAKSEEPLIVRVPATPAPRMSNAAAGYMTALSAVQGEAVDQFPFGSDGSLIKVTLRESVRREFYAAYPADGDTEAKRQETKRKAFNNGERALVRANKIITRTLGFTDYVWKVST